MANNLRLFFFFQKHGILLEIRVFPAFSASYGQKDPERNPDEA